MTQEDIRISVLGIKTSLDLLTLLNKVKRDIYGDKCHPFSLSLLNYYCSPHRARKAYTHFKIPKKSGGFREISAPVIGLKSILTCLNVIFQALYVPSSVAHGFLPGKSVVDNAKSHVGMQYIFNTDLEDFFPSIDQGRVWTVLQLPEYGFSKDIARMIAGLCCMAVEDAELSKDGVKKFRYILPQGAPTSPILTNMVCRKLDRRLQGMAKRFNLKCTRYADDITFSGMHNVFRKGSEFRIELEKVITGQGFRMKAQKTRLQKKGERQEVTGLTVCEKVNVPRQYVRDLQSILYIWERYGRATAAARFSLYYHARKPLAGTSVQNIMERVIMGKLMYLKMVKGEDDNVFSRLYFRFMALCPAADKENSGYRYDLASTVAKFERDYETAVTFKAKDNSECSNEGHDVYAVTRLNGHNEYVRVSRKCSSLVRDALSGKGSLTLAGLKEKLFMVHCGKDGGRPFWMVMKSVPVAAVGSRQKSFEPGFAVDVDGVLADFVKSGFNLSILDKWEDRTNSN